jgi:hypothetical protein
MVKPVLHYEKMVEDAMRGVVREALSASINGLPGNHHFFITFRTRHPGVEMADYLRARHPDEMTIVLQHQYWGLEVTPEWFAVTLSFNRAGERLVIPFAAVCAFADPSAKFGLQFQTDASIELPSPLAEDGSADDGEAQRDAEAMPDGGAQVLTLDAFRKK